MARGVMVVGAPSPIAGAVVAVRGGGRAGAQIEGLNGGAAEHVAAVVTLVVGSLLRPVRAKKRDGGGWVQVVNVVRLNGTKQLIFSP